MQKKILASILTLISTQLHAIDLSEAIKQTEQIDPTLKAAYYNKEAGFENIAIARGKLLPQINSASSFQKSRTEFTQPSSSVNNSNAINAQVSLRQSLFRPRDWYGLSIGELQSDYSAYKYEVARSDMWQRVSYAWCDLLAAVRINEKQSQVLKAVEQASKQGALRYKAGDGTKDAAAELKAQYDLAKSLAFEAQENLQAKIKIFKRLTGVDSVNVNALKAFHFQVSQLNTPQAQLSNLIMELNPELWAATVAENINQKRFLQAKSDHYPTVDLVGSYAQLESDSVSTLGRKYSVGQYGVQVSIPIFSGGTTSATERQAAAAWSASMAEKKSLEQKIESQFFTDWSNYVSSIERVRSAQSLVFAAEEQKKSASLSLKHGVKSWVELSNAELQLARREIELINLQISQVKAEVRLVTMLPIEHDIAKSWLLSFSSKK